LPNLHSSHMLTFHYFRPKQLRLPTFPFFYSFRTFISLSPATLHFHPFYLSMYRHSPHRSLATAEYSLGFKRILATMPWIFPERARNSYSETRTPSHLYGNRDVFKYIVIETIHRTLTQLTCFRKAPA
jgi:hypothetical protein